MVRTREICHRILSEASPANRNAQHLLALVEGSLFYQARQAINDRLSRLPSDPLQRDIIECLELADSQFVNAVSTGRVVGPHMVTPWL